MASVRHCLYLLLLSCLLTVNAKQDFTSIYSFGDSSVVADDIAATLNLSPPKPYYPQQQADFVSGLSFATPEAIIMGPIFFLKNGVVPPPHSHYQSQISTFTNFFHKDCPLFHDSCGKNRSLVQNALIFLDQPGINDYKHAFLHGKSISEVSLFVPDVVDTIIHSVERLVNEAGAKTIFVSGSLPMGCFPGYRTLFPEGDTTNECHKELNKFSELHNAHLQRAIEELHPKLKYPEVQIIYADYYNGFRVVLRDHALLGFKADTLMKACCGSGSGVFNFDLLNKCGEKGVVACTDRASHIHWDGFQLTPEALENLIRTLFIRDDTTKLKN